MPFQLQKFITKVNHPIAVRIGVGPIAVKIVMVVYIWVLNSDRNGAYSNSDRNGMINLNSTKPKKTWYDFN